MPEGGHDGAWYCGKRPQFDEKGRRNFCPPEGCPKGYCVRDVGWRHGDPSPDECTHIIRTPPASQSDEALVTQLSVALRPYLANTTDVEIEAARTILPILKREVAKAKADAERLAQSYFRQGFEAGRAEGRRKGIEDAWEAEVAFSGMSSAEPSLRQMVEHYYRSHHMPNWAELSMAYFRALAEKQP